MEKEYKVCIFCEEGLDNIEHYVGECVEVKEWFAGLGSNVNERIQKLLNDDLEEEKGKILERLWKEKREKRKRKKKVYGTIRRAYIR